LNIDHIGYAVRNINKAKEHFEILGFIFEHEIEDLKRNIKIMFGNNNGYRIELVTPLNKEMESPVDNYLSNSFGMPYHICYISNDFDADLEKLKEKGFKVIVSPDTAVGFDGRRVVFMMCIGTGLLEIVEN